MNLKNFYMNLNFISFCFLLFMCQFAGAQSNQSVITFPGATQYLNRGFPLAENAGGDIFVGFVFQDSLWLESAADSIIRISKIDTNNICIARLNSDFQVEAYTIFGFDYPYDRNYVKDISISKTGDVFVTGNYYQNIISSNQDTLLYVIVGLDYFLMQLDEDLNLMNIQSIGGSNNVDFLQKPYIREDTLFLFGKMTRSFDYDFSDSVQIISGHGSGSPFVAKYDLDLNLQWANVLSNASQEGLLDLTVAEGGNIYGISTFTDTIWLEKGIDTTLLIPEDASDLLLLKWSAQGELLWFHKIGGTSSEINPDLEILSNGMLCFSFFSTSPILMLDDSLILDFAAAPSNHVILQFADDGQLNWSKTALRYNNSYFTKLIPQFESGFSIIGKHHSSNDYDYSENVFSIDGGTGNYFAKYDSEGNLESVKLLSNGMNVTLIDALVNENGKLITSGYVDSGTYQFNLLPEVNNIISDSQLLFISEYCFPEQTFILDSQCEDGEISLISDPSGFNSLFLFTLDTPGNTIEGDTFLTTEKNGIVYHVVYDEDGCPGFEEIDLSGIDCTTTALYFSENDYSVKGYPNPFAEFIKIESDHPVISYQCYDMQGKLILTEIFKLAKNSFSIQLPDLPTGQFVVQLRDQNLEVTSLKVLKVK